MKKILTGIACLIIAASVAYSSVASACLPMPLDYNMSNIPSVGSSLEITGETEDTVTVKGQAGDSFKVLMFTDMHLDGKNKTSRVTVSHLVDNIVREKPDLVILGGDNVTSGLNGVRSHQLAKIFEKLGVYWAGVLGNHEGDNNFSISRAKMVKIFSSYDHCLMKSGLPDVDGDFNYTLRILNADNTLKEAFFFFDTYDMMSEQTKEEYGLDPEKKATDCVRYSQVEWYREKVDETKQTYGDFKSIIVIHHPLPQFTAAAESGEFLFGGQLEGVCASGFDTGLFDAAKQGGSTQAVFCGHDHLNNFGAEYDGILLSYIEPSGYGSYTTESKLGYEEKDWLQGYTVLIIADEGTFEQTQVRNAEIV